MNHNILLPWHPMIGCDVHDTIVPPQPPPPVPSPHFVAQILNGLNITSQWAGKEGLPRTKVMASGFPVMNRGTDIGPGIGHVATNVLFPIHVLCSGSISEFGAFTVLAANKPVAIACIPYLPVHINLNCQGPSTPPIFPMPTGGVIAPNSVKAGMTWGDFFASMLSMGLDSTVQGLLNLLWRGSLGKPFEGLFNRFIGPQLGRMMFRTGLAGTIASPLIGYFVKNLPAALASMFVVGSPVGYSAGHTPTGGFYSARRDETLTAVSDYFNGTNQSGLY